MLAMAGPARASVDVGRLAQFAAELRATVRADRVVLPVGDPPVALTRLPMAATCEIVGPLVGSRVPSAAAPAVPTTPVGTLAVTPCTPVPPETLTPGALALTAIPVPDGPALALVAFAPAFHNTVDPIRPAAPTAPTVPATQLDVEIARNVFDAVRAGQLPARNPALRPDLVTLLAATAFTPEGYHVFETILLGCAGRNDTARLDLLAQWAASHQEGVHADLLGYYGAFHLHTTGERAGAIRACRDLADNSPALADRALLLLALAHSQAGKLTDARATLGELDRRFASSPVAAEGLYLQAWLCLQEGNREAASALLRRITSTYPKSPTASKARDALSALEEPS